MLFIKNNKENYFYIIGGGVLLGETSKDCIVREIFEESGLEVEVDHLYVIVENFFKGNEEKVKDYNCQIIEFFYLVHLINNKLTHLKNYTDQNEELVWIPLEEIKNKNIKPHFISEKINEILSSNTILHIIEETDK